jgi:hypothetical protein
VLTTGKFHAEEPQIFGARAKDYIASAISPRFVYLSPYPSLAESTSVSISSSMDITLGKTLTLTEESIDFYRALFF